MRKGWEIPDAKTGRYFGDLTEDQIHAIFLIAKATRDEIQRPGGTDPFSVTVVAEGVRDDLGLTGEELEISERVVNSVYSDDRLMEDLGRQFSSE